MPPTKKKKEPDWLHSKGRKLLIDDIRTGRIPADMDWEEAFEQRPEFDVGETWEDSKRLFEGRIQSAWSILGTKTSRAAVEHALLMEDRAARPFPATNHRGEVQSVLDAKKTEVDGIVQDVLARATFGKLLAAVKHHQLSTLSLEDPYLRGSAVAVLELLQRAVGDGGGAAAAKEQQLQEQLKLAEMEATHANECAEWQHELEAGKEALPALQLQLDEANAAQQLLQSQLDEANAAQQQRNQEMETQLAAAAEDQLGEMQWQLDGTKARYEALETSSKMEARSYRADINRLQAGCKSRDSTITTLQSEISRLQGELDRAQDGAVADENVDPN